MAKDQDLGFSFDAMPFSKGIDKVISKMGKMEDSAKNVAKGMSKGFSVILAKVGLIAGAFLSIRSALNKMPEIGKAFGIAKDTFMKNFLFPLRKEIMPLLQKMLDWTRDHRALFVKWGQTVANVFRSAVSAFKVLVDFAKDAVKTISSSIGTLFGDTIGSFDELLNMLSFKLAVAFEFLKLIAKPIRDVVEPIIKLLAEVIASFTGGFLKGISGIEGPLLRIFEAMSGIVKALFTGKGPLQFWKDVFEVLGFVIGTTLRLAFEGIAIVLETIEKTIQLIKDFFTSEAFSKFVENTVKLFNAVGKNIAIGAKAQQASGAPMGGGRAIMGAFGPSSINKTGDTNIENTITIYGTNTDTPEQTAKAITDALLEQYNLEFSRSGF